MRSFSITVLAGCCVLAVSSMAMAEDRLDDTQLDSVTAAGLFDGLGLGGFNLGGFGGLFDFGFVPLPPTCPTANCVDVGGELIPVTTTPDPSDPPAAIPGGTQTNTITQSLPGFTPYFERTQTNSFNLIGNGGRMSPGTSRTLTD